MLQLPRTTGGLHISPSTGGQKSSGRWAAVSAAIPAGDRLRLTTEREERRPGTWDGRARWQPLCWNRPLRGLPLLLAQCWLAAGWGLALPWRHLQQPGVCSQTQQRPGEGFCGWLWAWPLGLLFTQKCQAVTNNLLQASASLPCAFQPAQIQALPFRPLGQGFPQTAQKGQANYAWRMCSSTS